MSHQICEFNLPPLKKKRKAKSPSATDISANGMSIKKDSPGSPIPDDPKHVELPKYFFRLEGNNEFDQYIFGSLLDSNSIELYPVESIKRTILTSNGTIFLQAEGNMEDVEERKVEIEKINQIIGNVGPKLVALYFRIVHTSFPILSKNKFLEEYTEDQGHISPCLLSCLYLFALNWWSFDSDLSIETKPSQKEIEVLAEANFYREIKKPMISTVQAGLLLIQHQSFRDRYDNPCDCWPHQSAVYACAQSLGLNKDCSSWNIPVWEKSLRRRLSWGLYVQEKWLSFTSDKRSHIDSKDWTVGDLDPIKDFEDFKETEMESENIIDGKIDLEIGKTLFLQKVELTKIVNEILLRLHSEEAKSVLNCLPVQDPLLSLKKTLEYIKPLQIRLTAWESRLPTNLVIETNVSRGFISGAPNIYISNFSAQVSVLRPVLRILSSIRESKLLVDKEFIGIRDIVYNKCMTILEKFIKFLSELRAEHLQTFWYTSARNGLSNIVVFEFLLALVSKNKAELDNCLDKIEESVWKLKLNNKNAEFFSHAISWWNILKKHLTFKLENFVFYNEGNIGENRIENGKIKDELIYEDPNIGNSLTNPMDRAQTIGNESYLSPEYFNIDSMDNFIFTYQNGE
ncbi:hypothetical protein PSN45_004226 [Yamadazyma tenuis]|nr:hypothetical protein PSN45_004226 [Yamadazyma tenuis]